MVQTTMDPLRTQSLGGGGATYSDLVVVALVLHVLVKLLLGVKLDAAHLQLLPHLQQRSGKPSEVRKQK